MEIRGNRLAYFESFSDRDLEPDRRQGRADGREGLPPVDATTFHFSEQEIIGRIRADLSEFMQEVHERRAAYQEERDSKIQRVQAHNALREVHIHEHKSRLEALRRLQGDGSPLYQQAKDAFDEAADTWRNKADDMGRPVAVYLRNRIYYLILVLLAFAEVPINQPAIVQVFRESVLLSFLLAAVMGILLIVLAHTLGRLLRQWRHAWDNREGVVHFLFIGLTIGIGSMMVYLLYVLRIRYMTGDVGGMFGGNAADLDAGGQLFLYFNAAIVLVGTMVAFAHHDSDPDYQAAYDHYRSAKKTFDRFNERYEIERHKLQRRFDLKSASNAREVERLQVEVEVTFKALANLERQKTGFIDRILHVMRMRLTAYQSANLRARGANGLPVPAYFGEATISVEAMRIRTEFDTIPDDEELVTPQAVPQFA